MGKTGTRREGSVTLTVILDPNSIAQFSDSSELNSVSSGHPPPVDSSENSRNPMILAPMDGVSTPIQVLSLKYATGQRALALSQVTTNTFSALFHNLMNIPLIL